MPRPSRKIKHYQALKEIEESRVLVKYLLYHGLDFEVTKNFSSKHVMKAMKWNDGRNDGGSIH